MDFETARVNREVKKYDRHLFARRHVSGMIRIYREPKRVEVNTFQNTPLLQSPLLILCLTDDWSIDGQAVSWGLEPVMVQIRSMDSHNRDIYQEVKKSRDKNKELADRALRNEMKARAYDVRRDFARATNDINTSNLEKVGGRR